MLLQYLSLIKAYHIIVALLRWQTIWKSQNEMFMWLACIHFSNKQMNESSYWTCIKALKCKQLFLDTIMNTFDFKTI